MNERSLRRRESRNAVQKRTWAAATSTSPAATYFTRSHSSATTNAHPNHKKSTSDLANNNNSSSNNNTLRVRTLSLLPPNNKMTKRAMLETFQPWVTQTYGDSAKTKTITRRKYARILKTLRGEDPNNAENSKFRFWVKAKGFRLGPPPGHPKEEQKETDATMMNGKVEPDLYVPAATIKTAKKEVDPGLYVPTNNVKDSSEQVYKKVAVVENFFDIIYDVHVETEGKGGKHAGQKRTYRAVTETYAFLPREAVTKFLLQCTDCQRRGTTNERSSGSESPAPTSPSTAVTGSKPEAAFPPPPPADPRRLETHDIDFSLPITTTYLKRMKSLGYSWTGEDESFKMDVDKEIASSEVENTSPDNHIEEKRAKSASPEKNGEWTGYQQALGLKKMPGIGNGNGDIAPSIMGTNGTSSIMMGSNGLSVTKEHFREQSSPMAVDRPNHEVTQDETSSNGNKEDDDDDDDESEDKMDTQQHDPERLKAFNMFVRLFVDENLDRMVPISKQPKEKIQAIIDSCTRQFPEFSERARKRIRTYLKSCRRNKRSREANGWESTRPTPAHLTSVQAEQILAQACDNESQNAKRMRMGLEPVSQPMPLPLVSWLGLVTSGTAPLRAVPTDSPTTSTTTIPTTTPSHSHSDLQGLLQLHPPSSPKVAKTAESANSHLVGQQQQHLLTLMHAAAAGATLASKKKEQPTRPTLISDKDKDIRDEKDNKAWNINKIWYDLHRDAVMQQGSLLQAERPPSDLVSSSDKPMTDLSDAHPAILPLSKVTSASNDRPSLPDFRSQNGSSLPLSMYQSPFSQSFQRAAFSSPMFPSPTFGTNNAITSSDDLGPTDLSMKSKPLLNHKLNPTEIATVRQLITGYRESAAFLLRSADELEQLLLQQQ